MQVFTCFKYHMKAGFDARTLPRYVAHQKLAAAYHTGVGDGLSRMQQYPVVVRTEIDYRRAAKLGDHLVIDGWLDKLQRARFWCGFRIERPADTTLIAECRQTLALIEMPSAKLLRLPDHWQGYRRPND